MNKYNKEGLREGLWEVYIDGRLWYKGTYIKGNEHGLFEYYYSNGDLWFKGTYVNGKRYGLSERYWSNGTLYFKQYYL